MTNATKQVMMGLYDAKGNLITRRKVLSSNILTEAALSLKFYNSASKWHYRSQKLAWTDLKLADCTVMREFGDGNKIEVGVADNEDTFVEVLIIQGKIQYRLLKSSEEAAGK